MQFFPYFPFFCVLTREKFDADLEDKFRQLPVRILLYSEYILRACEQRITETEDAYELLFSWKDFVVSVAKVRM